MKGLVIYALGILVMLATLAGCKKDNITNDADGTSQGKVVFKTLFSTDQLPDSLLSGKYQNIIVGVINEDEVIISSFNPSSLQSYIYRWKNGELKDMNIQSTYNYGNKPYISDITQNADGKIYAIGMSQYFEALYSSFDNGSTFSEDFKFISNLGQSYALELYYDGKPHRLTVKKLDNGTYVMWLSTEYEYKIGGTGFSAPRFHHYIFTSTDGQIWTFHSGTQGMGNHKFHTIDNQGTAYLTQVNVNSGFGYQTTYNPYKTNDLGATLVQAEGMLPEAVSHKGRKYNVSLSTSSFYRWNGSTWVKSQLEAGRKFANPSIYRVRFTLSGRMAIFFKDEVSGVLISNESGL